MLNTAATRLIYCADTKVLNNFTDTEEYTQAEEFIADYNMATFMYDYNMTEQELCFD